MIRIGITGAVVALIVGVGINNGSMMNLHGGSLVGEQGDGFNIANIEPSAGGYGNDNTMSSGGSCGAHMDWIGHKVNKAALKKTGQPFRILPPNSMMSMDHVPTRINIHVDKNNIVEDIECG